MIISNIKDLPILSAAISDTSGSQSGVRTFENMPAFVEQAGSQSALAEELWRSTKFEQQQEALTGGIMGGLSTLYGQAPFNLRSKFSNEEAFVSHYESFGGSALTQASIDILRQSSNNTLVTNVRSIVALGYQSFGFPEEMTGTLSDVFSDLQNFSTQIGDWNSKFAEGQMPNFGKWSAEIKSMGLGNEAGWSSAAALLGGMEEYYRFLLSEDMESVFSSNPDVRRPAFWRLMNETVPSMIEKFPVYGWIIGACWRAVSKTAHAITRLAMGSEKENDFTYGLDGFHQTSWEEEHGLDFNLMLDADNLARFMNRTQNGDIGALFDPPAIAPNTDNWGYTLVTIKDPEHSMHNKHIRSIIYTGTHNTGFTSLRAMPGSTELVSGGYVTGPIRALSDPGSDNDNIMATGYRPEGRMGGYCETPVFEVSDQARRTAAYSGPLWTMIAGAKAMPAMFTIDAEGSRLKWERYIQRQFELAHSFSSGWFCQSNLVTSEAYSGEYQDRGVRSRVRTDPVIRDGPLGVGEVGGGSYMCDKPLSNNELGIAGNYLNEFIGHYGDEWPHPGGGSYGKYAGDPRKAGVPNYFEAQCNESDERGRTIQLVRAIPGKGPSELFELWKATNWCGDYPGESTPRGYRIDGVGSGTSLKAVYVKMLSKFFNISGYSTDKGYVTWDDDDFWVTRNLNRNGSVYTYGDYKRNHVAIRSNDQYAAFERYIPERGTYRSFPAGKKKKGECRDRKYTSGRQSPMLPQGSGALMWQYYPHPDALDYSRSVPSKALVALRLRQYTSIVGGHPSIWGIDPDNPTYRVFLDQGMKEAWQQRIVSFLQSPAYYMNVDEADVASPYLREEVRSKQAAWYQKAKTTLMPKPAPPRYSVLPAPGGIDTGQGNTPDLPPGRIATARPINGGPSSAGASGMIMLAAVAAGAALLIGKKR